MNMVEALRAITASDAEAVTKSDSTVVEYTALYVGGVGNVKVKTFSGNDVTFTAVPAGTQINLRMQKVYSTDTTATAMVGFKAV